MSLLNAAAAAAANSSGGGGGSGGGVDIWSTGAFSFESPLKDLLDSGEYTLEQLLAEDELLQELRGMHPFLTQYFSTERSLTKLLLYVTMPPPNGAQCSKTNQTDEITKYRDGHENDAQQQQQQHETPVNGNREVPSSSSLSKTSPKHEEDSAVKTKTMTNDDGGVEAVATVDPAVIQKLQNLQVEPGKWLLAQLENSRNSSNTIDDDNDDDDAKKKKHPEHDPEMLYIRFPFMACEIICCELESVIETLVQGHAVFDDNDTDTTNKSPSSAAAAAVQLKTKFQAADGSESVEVLQAVVSPPRSPEPENDKEKSFTSNDDINDKQQQQQQETRPRLLDLLFAVLYDTPAGQLDDYRAGYFDKILTVLFRKRPAVMRQYINSGGAAGRAIAAAVAASVTADGISGDNDNNNNSKLMLPMMTAMMRHLYSQSIMQIAQRLLLPPRPVGNAPTAANTDSSGDENGNDGSSSPERGNNVDNDGDNGGGGQDILTGEEDDDDEDDEDGENGAGIKCDWSKSTEALDLLLERLLNPDVDLDVVVSSSSPKAAASSSSSSPTSTSLPCASSPLDLELHEEQRLAMSLNASEVLITIIQNSLLSSDTMLRLTSVETLQRLTEASTTVTATYKKKKMNDDDDDTNAIEEEYFSPHESLLTSAMNVIESLILQLGGYGAVGTMAILTPEEELAAAAAAAVAEEPDVAAANTEAAAEVDQGVAATMPAVASSSTSPPSSPLGGAEAAACVDAADGSPLLIADLTNLLITLPEMLAGFSRLLRHPSTESWTSCMQFSKTQAVQLLGTSRLRIVRVLESLVLLGDPDVDAVLVQSDCLKTCLELFWEFPWCSMLHQSVANLLVHVFEGQNVRFEIQEYFLQECNLMGRLMDSFVETIDTGTNTGTPGTAPPTAADDDDGAAQPKPRVSKVRSKEGDNDDGAGSGGMSKKGMSSVVMDLEKAVSNANATSAMAKAALAALMTPDAAAALRAAEEAEEEAAAADRLPVSEDDIDAALEQQQEAAAAARREEDVEMASTEAVQQESQDGMSASASLIGAPAQSFRLGYMGHVIIICQALVQACSNDWASVAGENDQGNDEMTQQSGDAGEGNSKLKSGSSGASQNSSSVGAMSDETGDLEPLLIAQLVNNHILTDRWQEFVATTLSSEISIQSTPLGGVSSGGSVTGGLMTDLLSQRFGGGTDVGSGGRRPGLADDDGDMMGGDGGAAPPPPPRGIYGGGDIIDMDDNDLEVAANMMAGLGLGSRPAHGKKSSSKKAGSLAGIRGGGGGDDDDVHSGEFSGSGDSEKSYNSGETASEKGYLFDDPLGKAGGLGIELGKLTQYKRGNNDSEEGPTGKDDDDNSSSSSSQEAPRNEDDKEDSDNDDDEDNVPVMDLFAGNFHHAGHESPGDGKPDEGKDAGAFDFANFASAFESGDTGGGGGSFNDSTGALMDGSCGGDDSEASAKSAEIEAIFGGGDHSALLEEDDLPEDPYSTATSMDKSSAEKKEGNEKEPPEAASDTERETESSAEVVDKVEPSLQQQAEEPTKEDAWIMQTAFDIPDIDAAPSDELKADAFSSPGMSLGEKMAQIDSSISGEDQTTSGEAKPAEAPGDKPATVESDTSGDIP